MTDARATVAPWSGRRARKALAQVKAQGRRAGTPCRRCKKPIDYDLDYPHPWSCSVGHIDSRRDHPERTWDPRNWAPEHLRCNQQAGAGPTPPNLGTTSGW